MVEREPEQDFGAFHRLLGHIRRQTMDDDWRSNRAAVHRAGSAMLRAYDQARRVGAAFELSRGPESPVTRWRSPGSPYTLVTSLSRCGDSRVGFHVEAPGADPLLGARRVSTASMPARLVPVAGAVLDLWVYQLTDLGRVTHELNATEPCATLDEVEMMADVVLALHR